MLHSFGVTECSHLRLEPRDVFVREITIGSDRAACQKLQHSGQRYANKQQAASRGSAPLCTCSLLTEYTVGWLWMGASSVRL